MNRASQSKSRAASWRRPRAACRSMRMAILLRSPFHYRTHLLEALRRAGIPAHFSRAMARPEPGGRALLTLLECARERLSATRFAEYLSLGVVPDRAPGTSPPEDIIANWNDDATAQLLSRPPQRASAVAARNQAARRAATMGVVAGRCRRHRRSRALVQPVGRTRTRRCRRGSSKQANSSDRPWSASAINCRSSASLRYPSSTCLSQLPEAAPWGVWLDALQQLSERAIDAPGPILERTGPARDHARRRSRDVDRRARGSPGTPRRSERALERRAREEPF